MSPLGAPRDHFWLTIGMSKACRADLGQALNDGRLDHDAYAEIITKCRSCPEPQACKALLATAPTLQEAPAYCVNRDTLADLADV